jgi:soluble lytic murein transglycosylase-like protein
MSIVIGPAPTRVFGLNTRAGADTIPVRRTKVARLPKSVRFAHRALVAHRAGRVPTLPIPARKPVTLRCVSAAAQASGVPPILVLAILWVEGGHIGFVHRNRNGTYDLGPMQINTIWLPAMERAGLTPRELIYDGCASVLAGSMILRFYANQTGSLIQATGNYHSRTPGLSAKYLLRISRFLTRYTKGRIDSRDVVERANAGVPE